MENDVIIIGGGIAGLQSAVQLGRYMHTVTVVDSGMGRSVLCRRYHNMLGWPNGVSGEILRGSGRFQAEKLGVTFIDDEVVAVEFKEGIFSAQLKKNNQPIHGLMMLMATGVMDHIPDLVGLIPCLGLSIYICPDCDGYEVKDRHTVIMGSGDSGASMAITLTHWTDSLILVNHEQKPISPDLRRKLMEHRIEVIDENIKTIITVEEGRFSGAELQSGAIVTGERAFIAFGGNQVRSDLARQLGAERLENGHIVTDPRTRMTTVNNLWAAGDIGIHSEMLPVAMVEGLLAAVWMHKALAALKRQTSSPFGRTHRSPVQRQTFD